VEKEGFAVKRKRFSVEQIVGVLKQAEVGVPVAGLIRKVGISEQTYCVLSSTLFRRVKVPLALG